MRSLYGVRPLAASMEVKNNHAHVTTQRILKKNHGNQLFCEMYGLAVMLSISTLDYQLKYWLDNITYILHLLFMEKSALTNKAQLLNLSPIMLKFRKKNSLRHFRPKLTFDFNFILPTILLCCCFESCIQILHNKFIVQEVWRYKA